MICTDRDDMAGGDVAGNDMCDDDELLFAGEAEDDDDLDGGLPSGAGSFRGAAKARPWKIMIVDDDREVHAVTKVVLSDFVFDGRPVEFVNAYSAVEACKAIADHLDTAVVLLDVVMETDDAGLRCVEFIRKTMGNKQVRIILRTGQPGQAPERQVIVDYDINDYKAKSELTAQKLFTSVVAALRSYQHIMSIDLSRRGLEKIIEGSASLFEQRSMSQFVEGVLMQLHSLIQGATGSLLCTVGAEGSDDAGGEFRVLASSQPFSAAPGRPLDAILPPDAMEDIRRAFREGRNVYCADHSVVVFRSRNHSVSVVYLEGHAPLGEVDHGLLEIFCSKVAIAFDNVYLYEQVLNSQKATVYALGKLAEFKDEITGQHVRRIERLTAAIAGELKDRGQFADEIDDRFVDQIGLASILHDVGKVGLPDSILNKPARLTDEEMDVIRQHPRIGANVLREVAKMVPGRSYLSLGAEVAETHHEKFDGTGYPAGLKGNDIPIGGRITAVADVYDALMHKRPYKDAWHAAETIEHLKSESGKHFDPQVVDAFLSLIERGLAGDPDD
ncbi:transcriptional regulator [Skermanella aerolata]|uniref:Transcriptional regulator n=1 Tax=Skermanella aerolata TaxID=393310 RepID=A0A512DJF4_9PROT|nr:response regulator [Skermanella aerolata]KJB97250.1 phosphodiesterase [Skermanella aerolata KACC 11604]GEO36599.1 transcriptional regulator [Skermanella aerolata]